MKKEFINEAKRFQKLAGISEMIKINKPGGSIEKIWDMYVDSAREEASDYDDGDLQQIENAINDNKGYSTIDELINSINNIERSFSDIMGHYMGEFTEEVALKLNDYAKKINYPNRLELLKAFLNHDWDENDYDEEDRTQAWESFLLKIGENE